MKLSRNNSVSRLLPLLQRVVACVLIYALLGVETAAVAAIPITSRTDAAAAPLSIEGLLEEALIYFIQQKMGNVLPLQLDPSLALPTVSNAQLPGGPFQGRPLALTAANVSKPLPPGDYEIPVMAYCTQYSVHRPGRNAAAVLAPVTGTQAGVLSNLLWRGTQAKIPPARLQTTAWAIQAGVPYNRLSKQSQADINTLVPEYRTSLEQGFSIDAPIRALYNDIVSNPRKFIIEYKHAKNLKFPPDIAIPNIKIVAPSFDQVIARLGPAGRMYVQAEADQRAIAQQLSNQQQQQESLILHQAPTDPPLPPSQGPWTVRKANVAYIRFIVHSGNMSADNVMQIRILPKAGSYDDVGRLHKPRLIPASYQPQLAVAAPSVLELMGAVAAPIAEVGAAAVVGAVSSPVVIVGGMIAISLIAAQILILSPPPIPGLAMGTSNGPSPKDRKRGVNPLPDPYTILRCNPGRGPDGKCLPCPNPPPPWKAPGDSHGATGGTHWHWLFYNQDKKTCECFPDRGDGPTPPR